ncbi:MAG TPA: carboxypeptidase-like regulatory domain-containing protein, partial [Chitinophagaceae bacterium]|nr:carboxypeptidase-like regulatory domain-containing protein [Chitinophagaceae bacterium]
MRKIWILLLLLLPTVVAMAQKNGSISGYAFDSVAKQPIPSATVTILDKKDSSLVSFTMTDHRGWFELKGIPTADYRLMISHVNYHNCNKYFSIDENNRNLDLGNIIMHDVSKVLQEVVVRNEAPPVTLVGDTVQYNAGSFKTAPNATVEQLLKKLPGVNVDKDGTVTAQGEKVNRVLVDGKEFFSNDPKMATRNLNADAVDKVQVYDRQSDQAQLTGFDDGNYEKTINLKLKKDKKKGLFGKITAGGGDRERYEGRFNVNSFKGARQMSAIGMANNTNAEGFSFMDILNFTGAMNQMRKSGGNVTINLSAKDASVLGLNNNNNEGINTSWGGGFNYNNIIGTKLDLQSSYSYNRYNPVVNSHTLRQNIFQGSSNFYEENAHSNNLNKSQRLNLTLMYQLDSMHSIKFTPSFNYQDTRDQSLKDYNTKSGSGSLINEGITDNSSNNEGYNFKNEILFRKKFDRKGRTFSILFNTSINESTGDGSLSSVLNYYNAGSMTRSDTMNQRNNSASDLKGYNARVVYTEPLWKTTLLEFSAGKSR